MNTEYLLLCLVALVTSRTFVSVTALPPQNIIVPPEFAHLFSPGRSPCPGSSQDSCEDSETCCKLASAGYGCCPMEKAVCCSDGQHCCPHDTKCDLEHLACVKQTDEGVFLSDLVAYEQPELKSNDDELALIVDEIQDVSNLSLEDGIILCPDVTFQCKEGQSCCETPSGYGCCPTENAVCCGDGIHCCPQGSTCDITTATCIWPQVVRVLQTPMLTKSPARRTDHFNLLTENEKSCPDVTFSCPKSETCCQILDGWGCCPVLDAVCCPDDLNCCPHGSRCNMTADTCDWPHQIYVEGPMSAALEILTSLDDSIQDLSDSSQCPDPKFSCQEGQTCCPLPDDEFGCCPLDNAVCCSDGIHCCPENSKCDLEKQACLHENIFGQILYQSLTANREAAASTTTLESNIDDVICPDKEFTCHDGQTCCALSEGGYGCCPMPEAVCCDDKIHCCPKDTTCDVESGACVSNWGLPWLNQKWTVPEVIKVTTSLDDFMGLNVVSFENSTLIDGDCGADHVECTSPDDLTSWCCPADNTCCSPKNLGCCAAVDATCCADGEHCCFPGMVCTDDVSGKPCKFPDTNSKP